MPHYLIEIITASSVLYRQETINTVSLAVSAWHLLLLLMKRMISYWHNMSMNVFSLVGVNVLLPGTLASSLHVRRSIDPNGLFTLPDLNSNSNYDANWMAVGSLVECE